MAWSGEGGEARRPLPLPRHSVFRHRLAAGPSIATGAKREALFGRDFPNKRCDPVDLPAARRRPTSFVGRSNIRSSAQFPRDRARFRGLCLRLTFPTLTRISRERSPTLEPHPIH
jgi:hypothetical protein